MAAAEKVTAEVTSNTSNKVVQPLVDYSKTEDGEIWKNIQSQGRKYDVCTKCGHKRVVDDVYVKQGVTIATLRCPNNAPDCTFIQDYKPNNPPS